MKKFKIIGVLVLVFLASLFLVPLAAYDKVVLNGGMVTFTLEGNFTEEDVTTCGNKPNIIEAYACYHPHASRVSIETLEEIENNITKEK